MFPANLVEATFKQVSGYCSFTTEKVSQHHRKMHMIRLPKTESRCRYFRYYKYLEHLRINEFISTSLSSLAA